METEHTNVLEGELALFNCGGYVVDIFPANSTKVDFNKVINDH
jgi:hypothetical protein